MILEQYDDSRILDNSDLIAAAIGFGGELDFGHYIKDYDEIINRAYEWKANQKKEK